MWFDSGRLHFRHLHNVIIVIIFQEQIVVVKVHRQ